MAASASLAVAALFVFHIRRQAVRRRYSTTGGASTSAAWDHPAAVGPLLSGTYRGRSVAMAFAGDRRLSVTARLVNYRHLFAEFGAGDRLSGATWLNPACRHKLALLGNGWSVAVRDRCLLFSAPCVDGDPEWQRHLLDLTCDLADAVDAV
jgi:hypothetical protein